MAHEIKNPLTPIHSPRILLLKTLFRKAEECHRPSLEDWI